VRKIAPGTTVVSTLCGNGQGTSSGDTGPAWAATLSGPRDVAVDAVTGNVFIVESGAGRLRLIVKDDGSIRTLFNAAAVTPIAVSMRAMAWNPSTRRVLVADDQRGVILAVNPGDGSFTRIAGGGRAGWDNSIVPNVFIGYSPPLSTDIRGPSGLAVDASGRVYVTATSVNMVYMIADNQVQPIGGSIIGQAGFAGDTGLATEGLFSAPAGLAVTRDKSRLFVADTGNARVRQITQEPLPNGGFTPSNTRTPARTPSPTRSRTRSTSPTKSRSVAATRSRTKKKKILRE
jgi:DNA-binding beta-propeller fold protein YncE